jgi:Fur family zinc uptake transcriptional regulator
VKAYDLIARFGVDGQAAKPPTVYRALEFLERRGVVHRIASISAYVACTAEAVEGRSHAAAFLICDCCGATEEVAVAGGDAFAAAASQAGYAIERTTIEGHGRCPACRVAA